LSGAVGFAGSAEDTVRLSNGVGLLSRERVSRSIDHVEHVHGADGHTYGVAVAHVVVNSNLGSVNAQLLRRIDLSSDIMAIMGADYGFLHEVWVDGQLVQLLFVD
jgi:hypothetical protein